MRAYIYLGMLVASAVVLGGCAKNETTGDSNKTQLTVQSTIEQTRATLWGSGAGNFDSGDQIGLCISNGDELLIDNFNYAFNEGGSTGLYWDNINTANKLTFTGYFPYDAEADVEAYDVEVAKLVYKNQGDKDSHGNPRNRYGDLLWSKPATGQYHGKNKTDKVDMTFTHAMHQIIVTVNIGGEGLNPKQSSKVVIKGIKPIVTLDLTKNEVKGVKGAATDIVLDPNANDYYSADEVTNGYKISTSTVVAPQAVTAAADFISVYVYNTDTQKLVEYKYKVPETINNGTEYVAFSELKSGQRIYVTLNISKKGIDFDSSSITIKPWESQGEQSGDGGFVNDYGD